MNSEPTQEIEAVETVEAVVADESNYKSKLVYLNKQNRNTRASLFRSRSKIFHKWGTTYAAGKNAAKRAKRQGQ